MNEIVMPKLWALLLVPPASIVILGLVGVFVGIWRRWLGSALITFSLLLLFILSVPLVGKRLLIDLEEPFRSSVLDPQKLPPNMRAIVVLGGGRYNAAPEYGEDTVSGLTLERLRYTSRLARLTDLPVLVSGGAPYGEEKSEAELMQRVLARDFGIEAKWVERKSRNTFENALESKKMLADAGIRRVYLVTHAWHMNRAHWSFVEAGLDPQPAPTAFSTVGRDDFTPLGYAPTAAGLQASTRALRERIGFYWYKSRRDAAAAAEVVKKKEDVH